MAREQFQNELKLLHKDLIKMGGLIEESMDMTIELLETLDVTLAKNIMDRDDMIDDLEVKIESACITIIYKQQPVASDLRTITSILKIITDLERIADNCSDISEFVIKIVETKSNLQIGKIRDMAEKVKTMLKSTIDCYVNLDYETAVKTAKEDDVVDDYFENITIEIQDKMKENPAYIEPATYYLFIIKYLERMADHSTNICEWIAYRVTGRHKQYN